MPDTPVSKLGWEDRPVRVRGQIVGYLNRVWEGECAIPGCWGQGGVISANRRKGLTAAEVRAHFEKEHADA